MKARVLFLCTGNSARSQMAEALLRRAAPDRFEAFSAGTAPRAQVHPRAVAELAKQGIDIRGQSPKDVATFDGQRFDYVITVCDRAKESCPVVPGAEMLHWTFQDPAEVDEESQDGAFHSTYTGLKRRIELFVTAIANKS